MDRRNVSVMDGRDRREPDWANAGDDDDAGWDSLSAVESRRHETANLSLARRLERSHHLTGRVAHWLLIKGGIVIVLLPGLIVLGLVGAVFGLR